MLDSMRELAYAYIADVFVYGANTKWRKNDMKWICVQGLF